MWVNMYVGESYVGESYADQKNSGWTITVGEQLQWVKDMVGEHAREWKLFGWKLCWPKKPWVNMDVVQSAVVEHIAQFAHNKIEHYGQFVHEQIEHRSICPQANWALWSI